MKGFGICLVVLVVSGVSGIPFIPYEAPHFGGKSVPESGTTLKLKRSPEPVGVHLEIARVQAINRAYKKFSKRYKILVMNFSLTVIDLVHLLNAMHTLKLSRSITNS